MGFRVCVRTGVLREPNRIWTGAPRSLSVRGPKMICFECFLSSGWGRQPFALHSLPSARHLQRGDRKHAHHPSKPEQFLNTRIHAHNAQPNPFALAPDIMACQHTEGGRIHIGNLPQVKDVCGRLFIPRGQFKDTAKRIRRQGVVHIPPGERPGKSKDRALLFAIATFNRESCALPYLGFSGCHNLSLQTAIPASRERASIPSLRLNNSLFSLPDKYSDRDTIGRVERVPV